MFNRLRSAKGEVMILFMVGAVVVTCLASWLNANKKNGTVDTIENPAPAHWETR